MNYRELPPDLPVPEDDGAARHLPGAALPPTRLPATTGGTFDLSSDEIELLVVYVYPRTGVPGEPLPHGWNEIPGARGCTPQSCAFRDLKAEFDRRGATVVGLSAQTAAEQLEFAGREHIPYPLLADSGLELAASLGLPTFAVAGMTLYRRLTIVAERGRISHVFYPVFPPDRNAGDVLAWLDSREAAGTAGGQR